MSTIYDLMKGKLVNYMTDAKVEVPLIIDKVEVKHYSEDLEPATRANDWWPKTRDWTEIEVSFTNGFKKTYNHLEEIKFVEP